MENVQIFGYLGALSVGVVLGLMGSGGSIISIPIFTYLFHISPITTTAYSLFVVGTTSSIGVLRNWKKKLVDYRIALFFAIPAFIAVFVVRKYILPTIPTEIVSIKDFVFTKDIVIMVFLAVIMLFSGISMIRKKKLYSSDGSINGYEYFLITLQGIAIGIITGIVGIGGGFLIVPTLVLWVKLPMKKAVATSLFIIAIKSFVGFMGDLNNLEINWNFLLGFTLLSTLGIFFGIYLSSIINGEKLKKYFGWMVLILSIVILYKELF